MWTAASALSFQFFEEAGHLDRVIPGLRHHASAQNIGVALGIA